MTLCATATDVALIGGDQGSGFSCSGGVSEPPPDDDDDELHGTISLGTWSWIGLSLVSPPLVRRL